MLPALNISLLISRYGFMALKLCFVHFNGSISCPPCQPFKIIYIAVAAFYRAGDETSFATHTWRSSNTGMGYDALTLTVGPSIPVLNTCRRHAARPHTHHHDVVMIFLIADDVFSAADIDNYVSFTAYD